jgi:RTX calcium-binding nonapeptide repeat (4 copies)
VINDCSSDGDRIVLGSGNDIVNTAGGFDIICTRGDVDTVNSGGGADEVHAGTGNDDVSLGAGADYTEGGSGRDDLEDRYEQQECCHLSVSARCAGSPLVRFGIEPAPGPADRRVGAPSGHAGRLRYRRVGAQDRS